MEPEGTDCLPVITSISPATPTAGPDEQTITVIGNYLNVLDPEDRVVRQAFATLTAPNGSVSTIPESKMSGTPGVITSFRLLVTFRDVGSWSLRVTNTLGDQSNTFAFTVR